MVKYDLDLLKVYNQKSDCNKTVKKRTGWIA